MRFAFPIIERTLLPDYRAALERIPLQPRSRVLDIGTGTGALASALVERGHTVHGIDASPRLLARARARVARASFEQVGITELHRFESGSFDLVSIGFVLHGLSAGLRRFTLEQAGRISAGRVLVFDYGRKRSWFVDLIEWFEGPHYFEFVRTPFDQMLQEAGLRCELAGKAGVTGARWWLSSSGR